MKLAVNTNVLVRAVVGDDPAQSRIAAQVLSEASLIALALPCLCELVWVLPSSLSDFRRHRLQFDRSGPFFTVFLPNSSAIGLQIR